MSLKYELLKHVNMYVFNVYNIIFLAHQKCHFHTVKQSIVGTNKIPVFFSWTDTGVVFFPMLYYPRYVCAYRECVTYNHLMIRLAAAMKLTIAWISTSFSLVVVGTNYSRCHNIIMHKSTAVMSLLCEVEVSNQTNLKSYPLR